ncbi:MAG: cysteine--tRNA ligase [Candidatus Bipolaricaulota bacterium]|nr:cysteine--tRNA ligase [Candidatus Bipolaricaulota bacterium]MCS7274405.1 cysteine--tRNA ligase [Candidatus Bipolaricaulota bacterium]MDW8110251.1 cysteine--tRNA ligase [Candidatus Bipolaricaulota bacterium]MDW8328849.1 cysteine--tRNA ligase [Candidatus Bipolaricaulota bacterium]
MATLKLFNTLGRRKEEFKPLYDNEVGMYTCGPTVYQYAHIGNLRTYIFEDILRRVLEYNNYKVKHVMNITDVGHLTSDADEGEDKMEVGARLAGKSAWEIAQLYTEAFFKDTERLNILKPHIVCKATDHIPEQIALIQKLEAKGFTYRTSDGIYFDVSKFPDYGKLAGQRLEEKEAGARVEVNPEKRNPADFALWKFSPKGVKRQMEWDSPWGVGFPGWHIECSAMSTKYLGQPFDIHCGGVDHIPIHHTNEIAQSEAAEGVKMANFWLHGEFMIVEGRRMGKSEGNAYLLDDLIKRGYDPLAFRYLCLNTHYRIQLNFTWQALDGAQTALERLREHVRTARAGGGDPAQGKISPEVRERFLAAINDDLNVPQALGVVWDFVRSPQNPSDKLATLLDFDRVLGLRLSEVHAEETVEVPQEVRELLTQREAARKAKNFKEADALRAKIAQLGYDVIDTPQGPKVKRR